MKNLKSHFKFSKQERSGIFFLFLLLIAIQTGYFFYKKFKVNAPPPLASNTELQEKLDSLKLSVSQKDTIKLYPFNPNFITDYKGYTLGMSVEEIYRLHRFRAQHKFVNSAQEFQNVTQISDSLLNDISGQFKFPEWTQKSRGNAIAPNRDSPPPKGAKEPNEKFEIADLNAVTAEELKSINGVGETLSARIVKFRDRLGGFLIDRQLNDVYGLKPDVVQRVLERFKVITVPKVTTINLNNASAQELSKLVYIQKSVAEDIVNYRNLNGSINSLDELTKIENFPTDKIDNIALYLSLKK